MGINLLDAMSSRLARVGSNDRTVGHGGRAGDICLIVIDPRSAAVTNANSNQAVLLNVRAIIGGYKSSVISGQVSTLIKTYERRIRRT